MTSSEPGGIAVPDTPQTADTDAPPPSSGAPVARRAHRFLVPVLLVLATIVGIPAAFAVWVNRQALNTSNWSSTSGKVLEDKKVQTALSAYLVHELFTNVNVSADLQKVLPKQLQPLAGPAAAGLQDLAGTLAPKLLASPQAQALWVQANVAAHKELLKVLNGGGPVVSTKSGVVTLNLHTLVSQLAATLGVSSQVAALQSKLQGSTGASARAAAQKKLGITLPPANGQLVIMRSNQLGTAQDIANAVKHLAIVLPAIAILHVRARRVPRTRTAPADAANGRLVLRSDRSRAAADPQSRWQCGRQRPGQSSVEQAGGARCLEHRHVAAVRARCRVDRVRDRDRRGRLARRPNPPGHRSAEAAGAVVARKSRGRLLGGRRRAVAARSVGSDTGIPEYLVDPGVRLAARVRRHVAATRDRARVPRHRARPSAGDSETSEPKPRPPRSTPTTTGDGHDER